LDLPRRNPDEKYATLLRSAQAVSTLPVPLILACDWRNLKAMPKGPRNHPLTAYRERHGITLRAMADLIQVNQSTLSRIERGLLTPKPELFQKILEVTQGEVTLECPSCGRAISAAA
jgi:DNA-binding XRE family transcriptional regulator